MKRYHIVGQMSGCDHYNFPKFAEVVAETMLKLPAESVISMTTPFTACNVVWDRHYRRDFNPYHDTCDYGEPLMSEMLEEDIKLIMRADTIIVLDGWELSKGTKRELIFAEYLGKHILTQDLKPFKFQFSVFFNGVQHGSDTTSEASEPRVQGSLQDSARARSAGD